MDKGINIYIYIFFFIIYFCIEVFISFKNVSVLLTPNSTAVYYIFYKLYNTLFVLFVMCFNSYTHSANLNNSNYPP